MKTFRLNRKQKSIAKVGMLAAVACYLLAFAAVDPLALVTSLTLGVGIVATSHLADQLGDVRRELSQASENRESLFGEVEALEQSHADLAAKLKQAEQPDEAEVAKLADLVKQIDGKYKAIRQAGDLIRSLESQQSQIAEKQSLREDHNRTVANLSQSVGRTVPASAGTPKQETRVEVLPPTAEQLNHDVSVMIRCVALSRAEMLPPAVIAKQLFGNDRLSQAMTVASHSGGGFMVPENYVPNIIELLRARVVVRQMGPMSAPLVNGSLTLPKQTAGSTASYIGESQNITPSAPTGGQRKWVAKKLAALVAVSNDLLRVSSPSADQFIRNDLVRQMAIAEDAAFIRNQGIGNAPKGLRYWAPSANVIPANGTVNLANVTNDLGKLELALANANVPMTNCGWLMCPRTLTYLKDLRDGNGNKAFPELSDGMLRGYKVGSTTQIPWTLNTDESEIYFADFDEFVLAEGQSIRLEASSEAAYDDGGTVKAAFSLDQTVVRAITEHDFAPRHDEAVAVLTAVDWGA